MPWYYGPPLLRHLEEVFIGTDLDLSDPRFPVQHVIRPRDDEWHDFRGLAGQIAGGIFNVGDEVLVLPSCARTRITGIHTYDGPIQSAFMPMSVSLLLADDIDISRGDMIVKPDNVPYLLSEFEASVCWMSQEPLRVNGKYALKHTTRSARAVVTGIEHRVNISTLQPETDNITTLRLNDLGRIRLKTTVPLAFDAYRRNRYTGSFILIDEATNSTVAAGMIQEPPKTVPLADRAEYNI
jgi:bifunctional enzyme CysN/CysC